MKRRKSSLFVGLVLTCLMSARVAWPQQPTTEDLKKEIEAVKESLKAIQKDVQEIKALLQSRPAAAPPRTWSWIWERTSSRASARPN